MDNSPVCNQLDGKGSYMTLLHRYKKKSEKKILFNSIFIFFDIMSITYHSIEIKIFKSTSHLCEP